MVARPTQTTLQLIGNRVEAVHLQSSLLKKEAEFLRGYRSSEVIPLLYWIQTGKQEAGSRLHGADLDRNPFNDSLIASGSDDGKVFLWRVPENFTLHADIKPDDVQDVAPVGKLSGHPKYVILSMSRLR